MLGVVGTFWVMLGQKRLQRAHLEPYLEGVSLTALLQKRSDG